jgi:tetratricopeptide (TPR) repeat protein
MTSLQRVMSLLLTLSLLALSGCDGVESRKSKYLEQGNNHFDAKEYDKARISFQNVLQIDPNDVEANLRYGQTLQSLSEWAKAAAQYRRVLDLDPSNNKAAVLLARIYLLAREPDLALDFAEQVLTRNPADSGALSVKAAALAIAGDSEKAQLLAKEALGIDPANKDAVVLLASLYTQTRDYSAAEGVLRDALDRKPDDITLITLLAQVYIFQKRYQPAVDQLEAIARLEPKEFVHRQKIIDFYLHQNRQSDALDYLKGFLADNPEHVDANLALLTLRRMVGEIKDVDEALLELVVTHPGIDVFRTTLAELYASRGQVEQAISTYEDSIEHFAGTPAELSGKTRLAELHLRLNNTKVAADIIGEVLAQNPNDSDALGTRARLALLDGNFNAAITDLRTVLKGDPENATALALIADAHRQNGEPNLAIDYLNQLKQVKPSEVSAYLALSNLYRTQRRDDEALAVLEQARAVAPHNRSVLESLAKGYAAISQWEHVEEVGNALVGTEEGVLSGYYFVGIANQGRGEHAKAISWFDRALAEQPDAMEPMTAKVNSMIASGKSREAEQYLRRHIEKFPKAAFAYNLLGEIALSTAAYDSAEEYLKRAIEISANWWLPYRTLATVHLRGKNPRAAIDILKQGIDATGGATGLRERLALLLESQGDSDGAIAEYEALLATGQRTDINLNNLAMLLATYRPDPANLKRARELVAEIRDASNPAYLDTIGWIHLQLGENEQAVAVLKRAVLSAPNAPLLRFHLGKALYAVDDRAAARSELLAALNGDTDFAGKQEAVKLLDSLGGDAAGDSNKKG